MRHPDGPPDGPPLGLLLATTAKTVARAFDDALAEAGGSTPTWLILLTLKTRQVANQRELARAVGIGSATLTHHLDKLERNGLVSRSRDQDNRRIQRVGLTDAGEAAFLRLREAAIDFDVRLRRGLNAADVQRARTLLDTLRVNAGQSG